MNSEKSYRKDLPTTQDHLYHLEQTVNEQQQINALKVASNKQGQNIHSLSEQVEQLRQQIEKLTIR